MVKIELIYVAQDKKIMHLKMELHDGARVADALSQAKLYHLYPETSHFPVGIYARRVSLETLLKEGNRVEIYRPLSLDPKEKRRQQAKLKTRQKSG